MIEQKSLKSATFLKGFQRHRLLAGLALLSASSVLLLSGCSSAYKLGGSPNGATEVSGLSGIAHGGQFPVTGATISLYEIGATATTAAGYNAALPAALATATTDASGNWSMGSFTCANQSDELYLVATGGNPGLAPGTNNAALIMTTVAGPCNNLFSTSFDIDEVTTVATEFALSGFSSAYNAVGTSTTNAIGLTNAFATVKNLVNLANASVTQGTFGTVAAGSAWLVAPAYAVPPAQTTPDVFHGVVPYDVINTLANVLATCVNTASASSSQCTNLFQITGGSLANPVGTNGVVGPVASNTADAALYIAHNPGLPAASSFQANNLQNLFALIGSTAPFNPYLTAAPSSDYALTLNFVGGGLGGINSRTIVGSTNISIDQQGNVWVPSSLKGGLFELSNVGSPLSPTTTVNLSGTFSAIQQGGYMGGGLTHPTGLAIDQNGNVWVGDSASCLTEYIPGTGYNASAPFTGVCGSEVSGPVGVSVDAANQIWIAATTYISASTSAGAIVNTTHFPYTTVNTLDGFTGPDYAGNTWFTDEGNGSYGALSSSGTLVGQSGTKFSGPNNFEAFGTFTGSGGCGATCLSLWVPEPTLDAILPINTNSFTTVPSELLPATYDGGAGIAIDGVNRVYLAAEGNGSGVPDNVTVLLENGNSISPFATGYTGGSALTRLDTVGGAAIDQSGNVWVVNTSDFLNSSNSGTQGYKGNGADSANVTEFIGLANPSNPVFSSSAQIGQTSGATAAGAYGVRP